MNSFFAFLRGVNISGKNRVAMPELKAALEEAGFTGVATYLNSGNVLLSSEGDAVSVYIKSILPEKQKIKLVAIHRLEPGAVPPQPVTYYKTSGHIDFWEYGPGQITVF